MCRIANRIWCVIFSVVFLMSVMASVQAAVQVTVADKAPQSIATTDTDNNWLAKVKKDLAEKEYLPSINHKGLQSPNRAHNLRIYYTEQGIQVHDRTTKDEPLLLNMRLSHYGREKQLKTINPTQPVQKDRQIEYRYNSSITEWYDNGAKGLEHGFLLHNKLRGKGEVQLVIRLDGATTSGGDAGSIRLTTATGRQLQYDALKVFDARGKPVPARMSGQGKQIKLTINDDEAEWPLLVDPLLTSSTDTLLESNQASAEFGISVASAGDVNGDGYSDVVVGARLYDNGATNEGAAFVYHGSTGGLPTTASVQLESNLTNAYFGFSVASAGDVNGDGYSDVIVGSFGYANGEDNEGAAFIYHGGAGGLAITASVQLESNQVGASFGTSVASAGDVNGDGYSDVVVGAYFYGEGGAAFVYHGGAGGLVMTASTQLESNRVDASFGASVASAGDVNGDGYSDVVVGASGYDNGESNEGAAFVYHGGASGLATIASVQLESNQIDAYFGRSVASAGDVNGDGYSDVIVGAFRYDNDETDEGAAFVYYGGAGGVAMTASVQLESNQAGAVLGFSVASAGDVNGDGYSDVIVGANAYSNGQAAEGAAFIYHGSASGLATTMSAQLESNQAYANFGWSVASAGDVNGDSYSDVVVGAGGEAYEKAFVYHGGAGGLATTASTKLESNQPYAEFGVSVASAGDVNGDGYSDVVVGARYYGNGEGSEGAAFVYHGSAGGLAMTVSTQLASNQAGALFGSSVASAGDVNGDGYSDVIVGALGYSHGGAAFVYHGSAGGLAMIASVQLESNQVYASFGNSVASAGDVNGDGYSDVIVGADRYDNGEDNEGAAFIYHGNSDGRLVQARQYRQNTTIAPVALLGGSYAAGQFTVSLHATHPLGRGAVKLQVESCPNAVPFGDASCILDTQEAWRLVYGDAGSSLSQTISKQVEGLYQWRARILIAREGVLKAGIVSPANPAHSPWRRLAAHANNADIRLTNFLNDAPVIETGTGGYSLAEGVAVGTAVATIVASDVDGTLPVYSITLGNSAGHFAIDSGTGVITVATGLDYESIKHYSLTVSANDGALSDEGVVTIAITNVIDTPEDQLGSGGGGGCTLNQHAVFDPTLPVMLSLGLFYLLRRRRG